MPLSSLLVNTPAMSGSPHGVRGNEYVFPVFVVAFFAEAGACAAADTIVSGATAMAVASTLRVTNRRIICPVSPASLLDAVG
jgi:hypothetical protein